MNERRSRWLPRAENARRLRILTAAFARGGFTDAMLLELYRDDRQGLAEHCRLEGRPLPRA